MKKIMFSDEFMLTKAVLEGRKTQTRRIIKVQPPYKNLDIAFPVFVEEDWHTNPLYGAFCWTNKDNPGEHTGWIKPAFKDGEVVAVAQSYCAIAEELENCNNATCVAHYEKNVQKASEYISWMEYPGFNNKMFVAADLMPHQIRITDVRVERLQDISDEDCLKEGVYEDGGDDAFMPHYFYNYENSRYGGFDLPQMAYADLINNISGKGTWERNPYVFVYDFELVK